MKNKYIPSPYAFIIIKFIILIGLLLLTFMIFNMFKLEILNNITVNQKEYFKLLIDAFFNLFLPFFILIINYIRGLFPVISCFIEFIYLFLEVDEGSTNYLVENNINNLNSDTQSEPAKITESEQALEWKNIKFLTENQTEKNTESNSLEVSNSSNSNNLNKKTPLSFEEEDEEYKYLYEKGPEPSSWSNEDAINSKSNSGSIEHKPENLKSKNYNDDWDPYSDTSYGNFSEKIKDSNIDNNSNNLANNKFVPNNDKTLLRDLLNKDTTDSTIFPDTPVGRLAEQIRTSINEKYKSVAEDILSPKEYNKTILNFTEEVLAKYDSKCDNEESKKVMHSIIKSALDSGDHFKILNEVGNDSPNRVLREKAIKTLMYHNRFTKN